MKTLITALLAITFLLTGCTTPRYNYSPTGGAAHAAIYVEHLATYNHTLGGYTIDKGYYRLLGETDKFQFYRPANGPEAGELIKAGMLDPIASLARKKADGSLYIVTTFNVRIKVENVHYRETTLPLLQ